MTQVGYTFCNGRRNPTDIERNQRFGQKILLVYRQTTEGGGHRSGGNFAGSREKDNEACQPIPEEGQ